jgi:hypothetical protein
MNMNVRTNPPTANVSRLAVRHRCATLMSGPRLMFLLAAAMVLSACAVGNKYDYRIPSMPLPVKGSADIGLVVSDERSYILSKDKMPDFVGLQRGGYGNPFDVTTASGRPMAQDMAETLKGSLEDQGFRIVLLEDHADDPNALGREARGRGLHRVIVLRIKEWKTDTYASTRLLYDLQLVIVDDAGQVVARNSVNGSSAIGGGMPSAINDQARKAFENKIGQLFYPPEVLSALKTDAKGR